MRSGDASPVTTSAGRPACQSLPQAAHGVQPSAAPSCGSATMALGRGQPLRCQSSSACAASAPSTTRQPQCSTGGASRRARRHRPRQAVQAPGASAVRAASSPARPAPRWRAGRARRVPARARAHVERQFLIRRVRRRTIASRGQPVAATLARGLPRELVEDARLQRARCRRRCRAPRCAARRAACRAAATPAARRRQVCTSRRWRAGCARCARPGRDRPAHAAGGARRRHSSRRSPFGQRRELRRPRRCISASRSKAPGRGTTAPASMRDRPAARRTSPQRAQRGAHARQRVADGLRHRCRRYRREVEPDGVHRLAQVVAGGGQEARLGAVGRLGGIARGAHVLQRDAQRLTLRATRSSRPALTRSSACVACTKPSISIHATRAMKSRPA